MIVNTIVVITASKKDDLKSLVIIMEDLALKYGRIAKLLFIDNYTRRLHKQNSYILPRIKGTSIIHIV